MSNKRLFLFASFDCDGIIDDTLLHYLHALSKLGDIVFTMDNDISADELKKVSAIPNVLFAAAARHGEYDFGSYKRNYQYARDKKIINKYDWVYLVNDSVVGPLFDLTPIVNDLESRGADFTGLMQYQKSNEIPRHVQSWFMGLSRRAANSAVFDTFINAVRPESGHDAVVWKYEIRLSQLLMSAGFHMTTFVSDMDNEIHQIYDCPLTVLMRGIPFVKKRSIHLVHDISHLAPFTTSMDFLGKISSYMTRHGIEFDVNPYKKIFCLTILSIPIISIGRKHNYHEYKVYLFDKIPVCKIKLRYRI